METIFLIDFVKKYNNITENKYQQSGFKWLYIQYWYFNCIILVNCMVANRNED